MNGTSPTMPKKSPLCLHQPPLITLNPTLHRISAVFFFFLTMFNSLTFSLIIPLPHTLLFPHVIITSHFPNQFPFSSLSPSHRFLIHTPQNPHCRTPFIPSITDIFSTPHPPSPTTFFTFRALPSFHAHTTTYPSHPNFVSTASSLQKLYSVPPGQEELAPPACLVPLVSSPQEGGEVLFISARHFYSCVDIEVCFHISLKSSSLSRRTRTGYDALAKTKYHKICVLLVWLKI